jgi:hypothetical protein
VCALTGTLSGQLYYYIHQRVDPEIDEDLEQTAKLSTSANTKLLSLDQLRRETYVQETAAQLRLQMSAYMLSFLTNTLVTLVSDNMFVPGTNSDSNLLLQTGVVTCQGFLAGIVYARTANKGLLTAYFDTFQDLMAMISEEWARKLKLAQEQRRAKAAERLKERKKVDISFAGQLERVFMIFYQSVLLFPVSVWVWVPMGFIAGAFPVPAAKLLYDHSQCVCPPRDHRQQTKYIFGPGCVGNYKRVSDIRFFTSERHKWNIFNVDGRSS